MVVVVVVQFAVEIEGRVIPGRAVVGARVPGRWFGVVAAVEIGEDSAGDEVVGWEYAVGEGVMVEVVVVVCG